jgi:hypothetical protein
MNETLGNILIIVTVSILVFTVSGLAWNTSKDNDPGCTWSTLATEREDQKKQYNNTPGPGCYEVCEPSHVWFGFGEKIDCYWDNDKVDD